MPLRISAANFAALSEFERELISERTKAKLASSRARGRARVILAK
jgi:DNA invertase Pin-like site-specific DNA recombinase